MIENEFKNDLRLNLTKNTELGSLSLALIDRLAAYLFVNATVVGYNPFVVFLSVLAVFVIFENIFEKPPDFMRAIWC